jgi:hypothetical protein
VRADDMLGRGTRDGAEGRGTHSVFIVWRADRDVESA